MEIVPVDRIPKEEDIVDTPIDDLLKLYRICQEMSSLCRESNGIGLAAPQVGIPWRLFIMKNPDDDWEFLVNCKYMPIGDEKSISIEGCLSLKRPFSVERWNKVFFEGKILQENLKGKPELKDVSYETHRNIYNVICQHETDHTRGILISDIGEEMELKMGGKTCHFRKSN